MRLSFKQMHLSIMINIPCSDKTRNPTVCWVKRPSMINHHGCKKIQCTPFYPLFRTHLIENLALFDRPILIDGAALAHDFLHINIFRGSLGCEEMHLVGAGNLAGLGSYSIPMCLQIFWNTAWGSSMCRTCSSTENTSNAWMRADCHISLRRAESWYWVRIFPARSCASPDLNSRPVFPFSIISTASP